jgi:thiosulfate/3-mercaptopyruvate sulfurtransferase
MDSFDNPLVETGWLASRLHHPRLRVVDARWRGDGTSSRELYKRGHIPGAVPLDWELDLSWTDKTGLRFMLLPPERFSRVMEIAGIGPDTLVVAYADYDYSGAARLWWALNYYGHARVAVLNGGWNKWAEEGRPSETGSDTNLKIPQPPGSFTCKTQTAWLADTKEILSIMEEGATAVQLVDTRPPEQYQGRAVWTPAGSLYLPRNQPTVEIGAREPMRAGHLPGAINLTSSHNLNPKTWTFLPPSLLRDKALAAGLFPQNRIITYCGVGISASAGLLALYLAGYRNLGLYEGSWEEWGTSPSFPIE